MQSFGERLRHERETRNTTIDEIAAATGIHRGFLEALERNEFQALPGRAFGKFYLRAYAEILEFDPEPLIVHYDRERRDPPEALERPPDEPTLRRVEASLAKWRAERTSRPHGGREIVGDDEPAPQILDELPQETPYETSAEAEVVPPRSEPLETVRPEPTPKPQPVKQIRPTGIRLPHILAATVVGGVVLAFVFIQTTDPDPPPPPPASAPADPVTATQTVVIPEPAPAPPPAVVVPAKPTPAPVRARPSPPPTSTSLSVSDFGLGRQEGSRIVPGGETFAVGSVVAFSTRVVGGSAGQSIRHVWIHRGRAVQSIRLRVGAGDWRTHSTKTLWAEGPWSVEARDEAGRVLARASFTCEPARR